MDTHFGKYDIITYLVDYLLLLNMYIWYEIFKI